jgi:hypothetical protein
MDEIKDYYHKSLLSEVAIILNDNALSEREKFARITFLSHTVLTLYQVQGLDSINFQDLDLFKYSREGFKAYPFHWYGSQEEHQQAT